MKPPEFTSNYALENKFNLLISLAFYVQELRYWRNARTIASHNPRIYRDRIVGAFAVNGAEPPRQYRVGSA